MAKGIIGFVSLFCVSFQLRATVVARGVATVPARSEANDIAKPALTCFVPTSYTRKKCRESSGCRCVAGTDQESGNHDCLQAGTRSVAPRDAVPLQPDCGE